jgi:hypothetical protein
MTLYKGNIIRILAILGALVGWFAILMQLWLTTVSLGYDWGAGLWRNYEYFTNITNTLVVLIFTWVALYPESKKGLGSLRVRFAAMVMIAKVGLAYHFLLSSMHDPEGFSWLTNQLLHYFIPLFFFIFWFLGPHGSLSRSSILLPTGFFLLYGVYALVRGYWTGHYPYHFVDASRLSLGELGVNMLLLLLAFLILGILFLGLDQFLFKRSLAKKKIN